MRSIRSLLWCVTALLPFLSGAQAAAQEDLLHTTSEPGIRGGKLVIAQRSEPRTFNPVVAVDQNSYGVNARLQADLIHINRATQKTEPALAKSWSVSKDGTQFTLKLRRGLRFSDGHAFDADDVLFSFKVYLDEQVHSSQRDLLMISGKPMKVEKLDAYTIRFTFPSPYSPAERVFDGLAILPRHLLEKDYQEGKIGQDWTLNTPPEKIVGLGAFRLKQVVPGDRIVLERNPYYWKIDAKGQRLPYLDELTFLVVPTQDAQVIRFQAGDSQIISSLSADNYAALEAEQKARHFRLYDAGPGLEYNFLMFNLNDDTERRLPEVARRQKWFRDVRFRQAVSAAIDRAGIVRLVYRNRGAVLATHVSPGNKVWFDSSIPVPVRSLPHARELLKAAGFSWTADNTLLDSSGQPVEFSIVVTSSNAQRNQIATLVQADLKAIGIAAHVVPIEGRSANDRLLNSHDYEAILMGLVSGDADPTPDMNVLLSNAQTHLWHLGEKTPATPWEAELDQLMQKQLVTPNYQQRKRIYDRVQEILAQQLPMVYLATPNILVGAQENLGNFHPAIIEQYTFWNAEELFWHTPAGKH
ncbi:MAG TPA: ABC transporter substrate-binding protein [Candidatus Dormibacteraeota bacterium]|nr:ABC transporter substrate-binding protein [Candidatus Dormibacteraeota bacterium]